MLRYKMVLRGTTTKGCMYHMSDGDLTARRFVGAETEEERISARWGSGRKAWISEMILKQWRVVGDSKEPTTSRRGLVGPYRAANEVEESADICQGRQR